MSGETIGLFGATNNTGKEFLKLALDAGYIVTALTSELKDIQLENENLTIVKGAYDDVDAIQEVVQEADYVVCLAAETVARNQYQEGFMMEFVKLLYPVMKDSRPLVFLYQASSLSVDGSGKVPGLSKLIHNTSNLFCGNDLRVKDHNNVIEYIAKQHSLANDFPFIVTRPGWRKNGPPKKKLHASKSLPTPFPYTYVDLAEFTLGAIKTEKLYNRYPVQSVESTILFDWLFRSFEPLWAAASTEGPADGQHAVIVVSPPSLSSFSSTTTILNDNESDNNALHSTTNTMLLTKTITQFFNNLVFERFKGASLTPGGQSSESAKSGGAAAGDAVVMLSLSITVKNFPSPGLVF